MAYLQDHGRMHHTSDGASCTDCGHGVDNIGLVRGIAPKDLNCCTRFLDRFDKL